MYTILTYSLLEQICYFDTSRLRAEQLNLTLLLSVYLRLLIKLVKRFSLFPQEDLVARLTREKAEQLSTLSSQLMLFESRLRRKKKEIEATLAQRETIIFRQQRVIRQLQSRLAERSSATRDSPPCDALGRLDSLGDSDSAVVLEDAIDDPTPPK